MNHIDDVERETKLENFETREYRKIIYFYSTFNKQNS